MQNHIGSNTGRYLGLKISLVYEHAAVICLDTKFEVELDDLAGLNVAKAFKRKVWLDWDQNQS